MRGHFIDAYLEAKVVKKKEKTTKFDTDLAEMTYRIFNFPLVHIPIVFRASLPV